MMKPGRRERNKVQCRNRILKSSRRLFTSKGYDSTTIEDIAEAAEISKATLYNYFSSKESLLIGIAQAALEEIRQQLQTELREEPSALLKLRRVLEALVLDSVRYIGLTRRILYLNSFRESELHETREELLALLTGLIDEAREKHELRPDLPREALLDAFMGVYLVTQFAWEDIESLSEEECVARVNGTIDRMLPGFLPGKEE